MNFVAWGTGRRIAFASLLIPLSLLIAGISPVTAQAQDGCGVGFQLNYDADPVTTYDEYGDIEDEQYPCRASKWEYGVEKDGIDSFVYLDMPSDADDKYNTDDETLRIYCQDKQLGVWISVEYADSTGWQGNAKVRFDAGKIVNLPYTVGRTFTNIYPNSAINFVTSLLKAKKVLVKINTVNGSEVVVFTRSDLINYRKKFAANGCKY
jgi:hypothetical protein